MKKALLIGSGLLLLLAIAGLLGASAWFRGFLASEQLRAAVERGIGSGLAGNATLRQLSWTGWSVFSDGLELHGSGGPVRILQAEQLRGEVNWRAAFGGAWRVETLSVGYASGELSTEPPRPPEELTGSTLGKTGPVDRVGNYLPNRFELGRLRIERTNLKFGHLQAEGVTIDASPDGNGWVIAGEGGSLGFAPFPKLAVNRFRSRWQDRTFFLSESDLRLGGNGRVRIAGEAGRKGTLRIDWDQVDVSDLLPSDWKNILHGIAKGSALWKASAPLTGNITVTDGRLENVPLLHQVGRFTGNPSFDRMPLHEFRGDFIWDRGTLLLNSVVLESRGLLRIEGSCRIAPDGALAGEFQVGVTPQTLQWIPGSRERVFTDERSGYRWTKVTLSGTLEHPQENLTPVLLQAMGAEAINRVEGAMEAIPQSTRERIKGLLDFVRPLVP